LTPDLWPMCMDYAVYIYNRLPKNDTGLSPLELFSRTSFDFHSLVRDCHVWGAPSYTLEPSLAKAGVKIPKWQPRSRRGIFVGFSPEHSTLVSLLLNLVTLSITGQYHTVIDDNFTTVSTPEDASDPQQWLDLLSCHNARVQVPFYHESDPFTAADVNDPIPELSDEWLTSSEIEVQNALRYQARVNDRHLHNLQSPQNRLRSSNPVADEGVAAQNDSETIEMHAHDGVQLSEPTEPPDQTTSDWQRVRLGNGPRAINDSLDVNRSRRVSFGEPNSDQSSKLKPTSPSLVLQEQESKERQPSVVIQAPQNETQAPKQPTNQQDSSIRRSSRTKTKRSLYDPGRGESARKWVDMGVAALNASISGLEISREELSKLHALMADIETQNLESNHQPYAFASKKKVADPNLPSLRASLSGEEAPFFMGTTQETYSEW